MADIQLIGCPYDAVHRVKKSRFQIHLTRCRENHMSDPKFVCPFNPTHVYPTQEKNYHLENCEDRSPYDQAVSERERDVDDPYKQRLAAEHSLNSIQIKSDEDWGCGNFQYVPPAPPPDAILMPRPLAKRNERNTMYKNMKENYENAMASSQSNHNGFKSSTPQTVMHKAVQQDEPTKPGSSKSRSSTPRIAAGIYPKNPSKCEQMAKSMSAITAGVANLGVGRGLPLSTNPAFILNDKEFPAL